MGAGRLALVLAVGLVSGPAEAQPPISDGGRAFAVQVLGAERASGVDRLKAVSIVMAPWATQISFYYPPISLPGDLCRRTGYETSVSFDPVREGRERLREVVELAVGPGCRSSDRPFATVARGISEDDAADSLRSARSAQAAAASDGPLPFELSCEDELNQGCADGGRATLAALPIDQARIINRDGVLIARPWEIYWSVRATGESGRGHVTLRRLRPNPL